MKIWKMLTKKQREKAVEEAISVCRQEDLDKLMKMDQIINGRFPSLKYYLAGIGTKIDDPYQLIFKVNIELDVADFVGFTDRDAELLKKEIESIT